jgi:FixJ family two-component response regulator
VGYSPLLFSSGEEFLASGAISEIGCLIVDVRMAEMTGIELQREVRLQRPDLPIIFVSAHSDLSTREHAAKGGALSFVAKPFDPVELLRAIEMAFDGET